MQTSSPLRVYLADLAHDYLPARQFVPLGIGYLAAHGQAILGRDVEFRLFKSVERLLGAVDEATPDLVGFANYIWNFALTGFAARRIKTAHPDLAVVMGGPNIRTDASGIQDFLEANEFVDAYVMFNGEAALAAIAGHLAGLAPGERTARAVRETDFDGCHTLRDGRLVGNSNYDKEKNLDFVPSPYTAGILDEFLDAGFIPVIETNRGCPFTCTFCVWGISALNKLRTFSMGRVTSELDYICRSGRTYPQIVFADANFGILKRDVEISAHLRALYDDTQAFSQVELYWSKSAQDHMVDIGRNLGHLTHTYIAFQSLDDQVLAAIKRKNISTDKLLTLINKLRGFTHSTRTDLLVGLPDETHDSHLRSLEKALDYGINYIFGGEIRMLPGSDMDTDAYRKTHGIRTKYRFYEGCAGIYRGEAVFELEEVIRATSTMTEDEMVRLRILRAFFFGSITLAEHRPLIAHLKHRGVAVTELFRHLVDHGGDDPVFAGTLAWLTSETAKEWFASKEDALTFAAVPENRDRLFTDGAFVKLNFGLTARLLLRRDELDACYGRMRDAVRTLDPDGPADVVDELLDFCRERNALLRALDGRFDERVALELSPPTLQALRACGYLPEGHPALAGGRLELGFSPVTLREMRDALAATSGKPSLFDLSQMMQNFQGRLHLEPDFAPGDMEGDMEGDMDAGAEAVA